MFCAHIWIFGPLLGEFFFWFCEHNINLSCVIKRDTLVILMGYSFWIQNNIWKNTQTGQDSFPELFPSLGLIISDLNTES